MIIFRIRDVNLHDISMAYPASSADEFARLLDHSFTDLGKGPLQEGITRCKSSLTQRFKRYGRVFDLSIVDGAVGRFCIDASTTNERSSNQSGGRRPSIKNLIFNRNRTQPKNPQVSVFHEHLSSVAWSESSSETCQLSEQVSKAPRPSIVNKLIGMPLTCKLQKKNKFRALPMAIGKRLSSVPPILPPIKRVSALRFSKILWQGSEPLAADSQGQHSQSIKTVVDTGGNTVNVAEYDSIVVLSRSEELVLNGQRGEQELVWNFSRPRNRK
jgi:hypothetical protein